LTWTGLTLNRFSVLLLLAVAASDLTGQELPDSVMVLDSMTVSIMRGAPTLARTPFALSVLNRTDLRLGNSGASIEEALQGIPGVQVQNRYNFSVGERISIRGFGARSQFGVRGIRILVDGIPATLPDGQSTLDHLDIGSLGRVEVLRGPSAALYGNAGGGVISFSTTPPAGVDAREEATLVAGGNGLVRFQSTTSGSRNNLGYLVSVARLSWDGFRANPTKEGALYGGADRWNVNARVTHKDVAGGTLTITANFLDLGAENPGSLPRSLLDEGNVQAWGFNVRTGSRKDVRQGQLGVSWEGDLNGLTSQFAGWGIIRQLDNPIPPRVIDLDRTAWGLRGLLSGEVGSQGIPLTISGGAELEFQRDDRLNFENEGGSRGTLTRDQFETVSSIGFFTQLRAGLLNRVWATGGLRFDRFEFRVRDDLVGDGADESGSRTMTSLSPTFGLHVQASERFSVYGNLATSLGTPTTTELANRPDGSGGFNPNLQPSKGLTGEIGLRGQVAGHLQLEVNGWITDLTDELVPFEDALQPGRTFFRNSGASTYRGLESLLSLTLPSGWTARLAYTAIDATFDDFQVDGEVFDGNRIPGVARHRLDGLLRLRRSTWYGELRADYVGRVAANDGNSETTDPYALFGFRTGFDGVTVGRVSVSPFVGVENLLDRAYQASVAVNAFGGRFYEPGPVRSFFVGMTIGF
jgi:iron complex outermembrane recepter protein